MAFGSDCGTLPPREGALSGAIFLRSFHHMTDDATEGAIRSQVISSRYSCLNFGRRSSRRGRSRRGHSSSAVMIDTAERERRRRRHRRSRESRRVCEPTLKSEEVRPFSRYAYRGRCSSCGVIGTRVSNVVERPAIAGKARVLDLGIAGRVSSPRKVPSAAGPAFPV